MEKKTPKAMVFSGSREPFQMKTFPLPKLLDEEVLVEVNYATICSSDLHTYFGRRPGNPPGILGHEVIGKIVDIGGNGADDFYGNSLQIGDVVTWAIYAYDATTEMAQRGLPQKSPGLFKYGHVQLDEKQLLSGGFATHFHLVKGSAIFKLPARLSLQAAAPLNCTHATVAGAVRLLGDLQNRNVLVIGAGMLGLSACAMTRASGARQVWAMEIDEARQRRALLFGAEAVFDGRTPSSELKARLSAAGGFDMIIETSGAPSAMGKSIALLNTGGTCVWIGAVFPQPDLSINAEQIVRKILTVRGLHNYRPADLAAAIHFLETNHDQYPFDNLIECEFSLSQLNEAFSVAENQKPYRVGIRF